MERIKQFWNGFFQVPWKRRFYGGLLFMIGLVLFVFLYQPYSMEGDMGVKIIVCPFRNLTGLPCPGCGLTRAVCHLAHGEYETALSFHLFSPVFYLVVFAEFINSIVGIVRKGRPLFWWGDLFGNRILKYPVYLLVFVVVAYNFYRIWLLFEESASFKDAVSDSIIYRVINLASKLI